MLLGNIMGRFVRVHGRERKGRKIRKMGIGRVESLGRVGRKLLLRYIISRFVRVDGGKGKGGWEDRQSMEDRKLREGKERKGE